ncbi:GxxExxY protein [Aequorivita viscosa]|jgi:GxxExxY protein|nr:GxxExxY protein [Aequorivita viscosa]
MDNKLTEIIIGSAIEVHRNLGPGLLESAYQECLLFELRNFHTLLLKNGLKRFINSQ